MDLVINYDPSKRCLCDMTLEAQRSKSWRCTVIFLFFRSFLLLNCIMYFNSLDKISFILGLASDGADMVVIDHYRQFSASLQVI